MNERLYIFFSAFLECSIALLLGFTLSMAVCAIIVEYESRKNERD